MRQVSAVFLCHLQGDRNFFDVRSLCVKLFVINSTYIIIIIIIIMNIIYQFLKSVCDRSSN